MRIHHPDKARACADTEGTEAAGDCFRRAFGKELQAGGAKWG